MAKVHIELQDYLADPMGSLERARGESWLADLELALGVLTHADVHELLGDTRLHANFSDFMHQMGITSGPFYDWMAGSPLNRDGEEHKRWRSVLSRAFTPRSVERIRGFLRTAAHELVDGFADAGACEFVGDFADRYPSLGLCELIGVPHEDRDRFRGWANTIGLGFSPIELASRIGEVDSALTQLLEYAGELVERRRAEPQDDLVTRMTQAGVEADWTDSDVRASIAGLVFAGHETTKNQLGWMLALLSGRADLWDDVGTGAIEVASVVEEVLRCRSAVTAVGRTVGEPVEHKGERFEPGTRLLLSLWAANHDETVYPHHEQLDVKGHSGTPHLAFGLGAHHCLGAALARAELQESLLVLTARITCPALGDDAVWKPPIGINGPDRLPITFAARS